MNVQDQAASLRADYLFYCYRAQVFKNSHDGEGFRDPNYKSNLEAQVLGEQYEELVQRASALEEHELTGKSIFSRDYWQVLGYNQI